MSSAASGWYPDPEDSTRLRWWDGEQWTSHLADPPTFTHAAAQRATTQQCEAARYLRIAAWVQPLSVLASVATANSFVDWFREIDFDNPNGQVSQPQLSPWAVVASPLSMAFTVTLVLWVYRVVESGVAVGRPVRRSPTWAAVSLFIPVINLWFPIQGLRDAVGADPRPRTILSRWWALYLVTSIGSVGAFVVPFLPRAAGAVVVAALVGLAATFAWATGPMTRHVFATFPASSPD